jgi:poly-gamma-glutamate synthesis protein (capsule biosynthesis protein)
LAAAILAALSWLWNGGRPAGRTRNVEGPLTVAATGDVVFSGQLPPPSADAGFSGVTDLLRNATVAIANLEVTLLETATAREVAARPLRGPIGTPRDAQTLADFGFNVIGRANNHAADYGDQGIGDTGRILNAAGVLSVGCDADLARARSPIFVEAGSHRLAVLAVAASAVPEARAAPAQAGISGRPGVNPLRFDADITVDPKTYEILSRSAIVKGAGADSKDTALNLFGTTLKKGESTAVVFRGDPRDVREMAEQIKAARARAEAVVLTVHSHEPSNRHQAPADFLREFAHAAVDAGAALVVGHGPHQLRGIELYKQGVILYSLGNFIFQADALAGPRVDVYDAGVDLYQMALGAVSDYATPAFAEDIWWESVVAEAVFDRGRVTLLRLHPIELGLGLPNRQRGMPRLADATRGAAILERVARLSRELGTEMTIESGLGLIEVKPLR